MDDNTVQLCSQVINSFDTNTKVIVGAIVAILAQLLIIARMYIQTRAISQKVDQVKETVKP